MAPCVKHSFSTQQFWQVFALCLPVTIACIDLMALSVAIDNIMHDFSTTMISTQWLLSGYTIGTASFLITIGRLADIYGRRKLLLTGVLLFALSSFIASISNSIDLLIISRFAQGVASSIMMTTVISIITHHFRPEIRGTIITTWAFSLGMGMAAGPLVGGILIHFMNWRAIFAVNIPICFLSYYLIIRFIPESKDETYKVKIDWLETILLTVMMLSLVTLLSQAASWGWTSNITFILISIFIISSILFIAVELQKNNPLIDFSLFVLTNFSAATFCGFISYFCMYAWLFIFSVYLQNSYGLSTLKTGFLLSSFSIAFALSSKLIAPLMNTVGNKNLMHIGFILSIIAFIWMATIHITTGLEKLITMFFLFGMAITFINAPSMIVATENVPRNKSGIASGTIFTIRWLGGSIGIVVITFIYQVNLSSACFTLSAIAAIGFLCSLTFLKKIKQIGK